MYLFTKLNDKCYSAAGSVTMDDIKLGIAFTRPLSALTARLFCEAARLLAANGGSSACDKLLAAGGIPVIVELLACLPEDRHVVYQASAALNWIAANGSEAVKEGLRRTDIACLLRAASARLNAWEKPDHAAEALEDLGL